MNVKTIRGLASELARQEGKKSEARIGDIREILGILSDLVFQTTGVENIADMLFDNGARRAKLAKKTKPV